MTYTQEKEQKMERLIINGSEPAIDQGLRHGWPVSWNPDDGRYHVAREDGTSVATFKDWRNTVQYARTHKAA